MGAMIFYHSPGSSSMATHIALREVGVPFESRVISFAGKEHRSPGYRAVNPEGKVPALMIDGQLITEVAGTLYYLARRFPDAKLLPAGNIDAESQIVSWMSFIASHYERMTARPAVKKTIEIESGIGYEFPS
jgi:glutathione S-transferase